jgi:hypothetical protein
VARRSRAQALAPVVEALVLAERSDAADPPAYEALVGELRATRDVCLARVREGRRPES